MISDCALKDLPFVGSSYPWCKSSSPPLWKCLDHIMVNSAWSNFSSLSKLEHLNKAPLDHSPLMFSLRHTLTHGSFGFHFQNMWMNHKDFLNVLRTSWDQLQVGNGFRILSGKLSHLKSAPKSWSKEVFGN